MKVSIVTISYNQGEFLEKAITSVLQQDYKNIEYIVVDAGSTDGSREIIQSYSDDIDTIIFEPDKGPADGLNKGFSVATGDVFGLINSDDWLYANAISKVAFAFENNKDWDIVCGHGDIVDRQGAFSRKVYSDKFSLKRFAYKACLVVGQAAFFREKAFRQVGGYNIENTIAWDGELWVSMAEHGFRFGVINDFLGAFRVYPGTISSEIHSGDEFTRYQMEIFKRIMGRDWNSMDNIKRQLYRTIKYSKEPRSLYERLFNGPVVRQH